MCQQKPEAANEAKKEVDKIAITLKSSEEYLSGDERKSWLKKFLKSTKVTNLLNSTRHLRKLKHKTTRNCIKEACSHTQSRNPAGSFKLDCETLSQKKPTLYPCLEYEKLLLASVSNFTFVSNLVVNLKVAKDWCYSFDQCATRDGVEKDFPFERKFIDAISRKALGQAADIDFSIAPTKFPTACPSATPTPVPTTTSASPTVAPTACPTSLPTPGPTKVNQTKMAMTCVRSRCVAQDLIVGVDLRVSCDRLFSSMQLVNNNYSPCQYYETLMWHEAYRPQTKDPIFHKTKDVLKLCQAYAVCMGDFGAMQKVLQSAARYKKMVKVRSDFAASEFLSFTMVL
jgi:hypothetical protein